MNTDSTAIAKHPQTRTEKRFTAEDPWNQNRQASFTVENYLEKDAQRSRSDDSPRQTKFARAIRSELDGALHPLPESLAELCRQDRVPAEALPGLLKQLEPSLKKSDYQALLGNKALNAIVRASLVFFGLLCAALICLPLLVKIFVANQPQLPMSVGLSAVPAIAFAWFVLAFLYYRMKWRRATQMKWALAQLSSAESSPDSNQQ